VERAGFYQAHLNWLNSLVMLHPLPATQFDLYFCLLSDHIVDEILKQLTFFLKLLDLVLSLLQFFINIAILLRNMLC
jgi:hypothetical protein